MHFRRKKPKDRWGNSSDWRYPQVFKGTHKRSKASTKRNISAFLEAEKNYEHVVDLPN